MTFEPKIKVCGMCEVQNLHELIQLPIDFIGHIFFDSSKRNVGNEVHKTPHEIKRIAVFVNASQEEILIRLAESDFWAVQLHGNESPEFCKMIREHTRVIKAFGLHEDFDFPVLDDYEPSVDFFLFDTRHKGKSGGTGQKFNWEILTNYKGNTPYFLSGGIGREDVPVLRKIKDKRLFAIDVNSRFERAPGEKDVARLSEFIRELKPTLQKT